MIKIFLTCLLALILGISVGCSKNSSTTKQETKTNTTTETVKKGPTQGELDAKLKKEAIKADFVQLNGHESEFENKKVYAIGEISVVDYKNVMDDFPSFLLSQKEGNGYGVYHITNMLSIKDLKDGDTVKIYGCIEGVDKTSAPKIVATVIEKQ